MRTLLPWLWLWLLLLLLPTLAFSATTATSPTTAPAPKTSSPAPKASAPPPVAKATPPVAKATPPVAKATPPVVAKAPPPKKAAPAPVAASPAASHAPKAAPVPVAKAAPPAKPPKAAPPAEAPIVASPAQAPKAHAPAKKPTSNATHHAPKSAPAPKKPASPSPSPHHHKTPPTPVSAPAPGPGPEPHTLGASQVSALRSLKVNFTKSDPCASPKDLLLCDTTSTHVLALSLTNCPKTAKLTTEALLNLSTLNAISFVDCPMVPVHVPSKLIKSLTTFICTASLGRTGTDEKAEKLSGVWLSKLVNLNEIDVSAVEVSASGLNVITEGLQSLTHLRISSASIDGVLPRKTWPQDVKYIDVSGNSIRGTIPSQMRTLSQLTHLDLSSNQLKGVVPNIFNELSSLQFIDLAGNQLSGSIPGSIPQLHNCSHLDLSNNLLNGSVLANISNMRALRYLDLSQNQLTGPIPFNNTFLSRLTTFKIGNNAAGLCYNQTAVKSKFLTGIPHCIPTADNIFAPSPAPAMSEVATSSGGSSHLSKGVIAGISVVAIVVGAAAFFGVRKWWKAREDPDQFVNIRAQRS